MTLNSILKSAVMLLSFALAGCYESSSDLIGSKSVRVEKFDSLVVDGRQVYVVEVRDGGAFACAIRTKQDARKPCRQGQELKFERTMSGNYIVQMKSAERRYSYGLWMRSELEKSSKDYACLLKLGDGVVGAAKDAGLSSVSLQWGDTEVFQNLTRDLRRVATDTFIDRQQLLDIVSIYERFAENMTKDARILCLNGRIAVTGQHIVLDRDNRHLREIE